ncbi:MAG: vWA domain-containing protein [Chloroflexota bacterium]
MRAPWGDEVDGRRLLAEAVGFGRAVRAAGLGADLSAAVDFARALTLVDVGDREQVRGAGSALFVHRRSERATYDAVFDRWWRRRGRSGSSEFAPPDLKAASPNETDPAAPEGAVDPEGAGDRRDVPTDERGQPVPSASDEAEDDEAPIEGVVIAQDAYSQGEVLRHREFDRMTPSELREAERLVDLLAPRLELRRTRRYELHSHGRRLAPRAMFRRNLATGGQLVDWVWRRSIREPRSLVVLCDISGSMERHSRLLLRFIQALSASSEVRAESFVFGTRLTRVTRLLRDRDRDRALSRVAEAVNDWAGGTRIGESFREFNLRWARRTLRSSGVVIVISDGWDRGDPALVGAETARLRRNCHRLVWLNPLAGTPGYQPLAGGMRAAYPYVDDFLAAGTVANLERLGQILAGVRAGDTRRSSEAAAHVALPNEPLSVAGLARPPALGERPVAPSVARPLDGGSRA